MDRRLHEEVCRGFFEGGVGGGFMRLVKGRRREEREEIIVRSSD